MRTVKKTRQPDESKRAVPASPVPTQHPGKSESPGPGHHLRRALGNQAVQGLMVSRGGQSKLKVDELDDKYEQEADWVAEQVMRKRISGETESVDGISPFPSSERLQTSAQSSVEGSGIQLPKHAQPLVRRVLRSPGMPLAADERAFMERRFGRGFGEVRLHRNSTAEASASAIGARAYTLGRHIVFAQDTYRPGTDSGRRLLAHELTHTLQRSSQIQRAPGNNGTPEEESGPTGEEEQVARIPFAVRVDRTMSSNELLVETVQQYKGLSEEQAKAVVEADNWQWEGEPQTATEKDVERGFIVIPIRDRSQTLEPSTPEGRSERGRAFRGFPQGVQERINDEADRRFWKGTNYKPGQLLGESGADQIMAQAWLRYRDQVTREHLEIKNLPEGVRRAIFDQYATEAIDPSDYPQVLRIAEKLKKLSPARRQDYRNRINAVTDDLDEVEVSVDRYLEKVAERREEAIEYGKIERRLYGLEDLYHLVQKVKATERLARLPSIDPYGGIEDPTVIRAQTELPELRRELNQALADNGFSSVAEFEEAMDSYLDEFAVQARNIAYDMLDRLDHRLFEAQRRYEAGGAAQALNQRLVATGARKRYQEAWSLRRQASHIGTEVTRSNWREKLEEQAPLMGEAAEKEEAAWEQFEQATESEPLIQNMEPQDRIRLMRTSDAQSLRSEMLSYIADKRQAIEKTRANLAENPDLVFELDEVLKATYRDLGIRKDSIYDIIIREHIEDLSLKEAIISIAKAVIGLAAAIVGTVVGGPLGAGAALLAFGIGAEEAVSQFREWEIKSAAEEAELLSEEPSFGWVIVAVVGAGLDLGAAVKTVRAMSSAVRAFNKGGSLAELGSKLDELAEVDARVKANVMRAARNQRRFEQAVEGLRATAGRLNVAVVPGAEQFARLVQIAYYGARKGIFKFENYLLELKRLRLIDDIDELSGKPLQRIKEAHEEGLAKYESDIGTSVRRETADYGQPSHLRTPEEGPRPGETGLQYERRLFKETPLAERSKAFWGWRGGSRGKLETWFSNMPNYIKNEFASDLAAVEARAQRILNQSTEEFINSSSNSQLKKLWQQRDSIRENYLEEIQNLRARQSGMAKSSAEHSHLQRRIDALQEEVQEINTFGVGRVGNRRPDQIELFPKEQRAIVTDITLRIGDKWHVFKTMYYREIVREITGWDDVFAIEFRTARQQLLIDDTFTLPD